MSFKNNYVRPEQTVIASSLFLTTVSKNYDGGSRTPTSVNGTDVLSFPRTTSISYTSTQAAKAWGGVYCQKSVQGLWTGEEAAQSINWREVKAIELTLLAFPHLRDTSVLICTDNTTAKAYINRQG
jgi:hypothetical protein